jgi:acyl-CoA dehydrogenase
MDFEFSGKVKDLQRHLQAFMDEYIYSNEQRYHDEIERNRWSPSDQLRKSNQELESRVCESVSAR